MNVQPLGNNMWTGDGSPEGKVDLSPNTVFVDRGTGRQYRKTSPAGIKTGWVSVVGEPGEKGDKGDPGLLNIEARTDDPVAPPLGRTWLRTDL